MKLSRNGFSTRPHADRGQWVRQYRASGKGLKQFAQQHGLKPGQLHYWVYQRSHRPPPGPAMPAFQEVRLAAPAYTAGPWSAEIGLPNGTTLRLARGVEVAWAQALLDSLRGPCLL